MADQGRPQVAAAAADRPPEREPTEPMVAMAVVRAALPLLVGPRRPEVATAALDQFPIRTVAQEFPLAGAVVVVEEKTG